MMDANAKTSGPASRLATAVAPGCGSARPTRIGGEIYGHPDRRAVNALIGVDAHAGGADQVPIEDCGEELLAYAQALRGSPDRPCPPGAEEAVGFSRNLSFDEAFAKALASLPPPDARGADRLARVQVSEVGGLFGGLAGFNHLFVRVCRTHGGRDAR